jgi:ribonuclease Z
MFVPRSNFLAQSEESLAKDITFTSKNSYNCIKANVKQLILGHYSTRYENIDFKKRLDFPVVLADDKILNFK